VAGEDAGGVHGANRLGGNGVANSTVFGGIAGDEMANAIDRGAPLRDPDLEILDQGIARAERPFAATGHDLSALREHLWGVMWEKVGILRTAEGLQNAMADLNGCHSSLATMGIEDRDRAFNLTWHDWLNLDNQIRIGEAIASASLARDDSRGAHFREDFPTTSALESSTFTCTRLQDSRWIQEMMPVDFTIVRPGESLISGDAGAPPASQTVIPHDQ